MFTYKLFLSFALVMVLAGRTLAAFNVSFNGQNLTVTELLPGPSDIIGADCPQTCNSASQLLTACNDDANCLCSPATLGNLTSCEQCMFTELIRTNKRPSDLKVGSNPLLAAYRTACNATTGTMPDATVFALQADSMELPFVAVLSPGLTAIYFIFGTFFGVSSLLILCNM